MLSRLAENLFWLGRYLERAEQTARLADVTYHAMLESPPDELAAEWQVVLGALKATDAVEASLDGREPSAELVLDVLLQDRNHPDSVVSAIAKARENARSVRELISLEFWESVNGQWLELIGRDLDSIIQEGPYEVLGGVRARCQAAIGIAAATMPRGDGWAFLALGRTMERSQATLRLVSARWETIAGDEIDDHAWTALLRSMSALEVHRTEHGGQLTPSSIVELALRSRRFPRSVLFCLDEAKDMLVTLGLGDDTLPLRLLGRVRSELAHHSAQELSDADTPALLRRLEEELWGVADAIGEAFFRSSPGGELRVVATR